MYYYLVDTLIDHGGRLKLLTYSSDVSLNTGQVVEVPFGKKNILAIIKEASKKPEFATKPINKVVFDTSVSKQWLDLINWFRDFYPINSEQLKNLFLPQYVKSVTNNTDNTKLSSVSNTKLNSEQELAVRKISSGGNPVILHGEMGSGKTLVYLESAMKTLKKGRSVLILSPEIPLATQLYKEALAFFDSEVILFHSARTDKERAIAWQKCLESNKPLVVIGTRSALFLPIKDLGLVGVDEFHENAYRQQGSPHYSAVDVAAKLSSLHNATIVYGSATPTIKEFFIASQKNT